MGNVTFYFLTALMFTYMVASPLIFWWRDLLGLSHTTQSYQLSDSLLPADESMRSILQSHDLRAMFFRYLEFSMASENALFLTRIRVYKRKCLLYQSGTISLDALTLSGLSLYSDFIARDAPEALNLPGSVSSNVNAMFATQSASQVVSLITVNADSDVATLLEQSDEDDFLLESVVCVFTPVVQSVLRALSSDSLRRFRDSREYKDYVEERQELLSEMSRRGLN